MWLLVFAEGVGIWEGGFDGCQPDGTDFAVESGVIRVGMFSTGVEGASPLEGNGTTGLDNCRGVGIGTLLTEEVNARVPERLLGEPGGVPDGVEMAAKGRGIVVGIAKGEDGLSRRHRECEGGGGDKVSCGCD